MRYAVTIGIYNHAIAFAEMQVAASVPNFALTRRTEGMCDVAFHPYLRNAVEAIVYDDIFLVKFHGAKLQKFRNPSLRPNCGNL